VEAQQKKAQVRFLFIVPVCYLDVIASAIKTVSIPLNGVFEPESFQLLHLDLDTHKHNMSGRLWSEHQLEVL